MEERAVLGLFRQRFGKVVSYVGGKKRKKKGD